MKSVCYLLHKNGCYTSNHRLTDGSLTDTFEIHISEEVNIRTLYSITTMMIGDGSFFANKRDQDGNAYLADSNAFVLDECKHLIILPYFCILDTLGCYILKYAHF